MHKNIYYKDVILEKFTLAVQKEVPKEELESYRLSVEDNIRNIVFTMQKELLCKKVEKQEEVFINFSSPKSAWQHFKQDYFPKILLNYFPVKYKQTLKSKIIKYEVFVPAENNVKIPDSQAEFPSYYNFLKNKNNKT